MQFDSTVPRIKDGGCQTAAKIVLEPIFEADFRGCCSGFGPSAQRMMRLIRSSVR